MKKILSLLATASLATASIAPANAFIVTPDKEPEPEGVSYNITKLDHRFCFELDGSGEMISKTYNKKCVEVGRQTSMMWTTPEKCDDFEGCVKVGMLMGNKVYGDAYFDERFIRDDVPIFKNKDSAITYFDEFTINCQGATNDVALELINWRVNYNVVRYQFDVSKLNRAICNKAFDVDTKAARNHWSIIPAALDCQHHFHRDSEVAKREHCIEHHIHMIERSQWK